MIQIVPGTYKCKIENVVRNPETNELGFYEPQKLSFFDSESKFDF
jgi:hypothetical protein